MKKHLWILSMFISIGNLFAQVKPAYVIFNAKGKKVSHKKMMQSFKKSDVLLFGEYHNNPIVHWLQLEITKELGESRQLVLGAEMFEHDNQPAIDAYLQGKISAKGLDSSARLWNNYKTDYAPLVNYAKAKQLAFVATNVPRKYASMVSRGGFKALDTLSALEKSWMAPLPIAYDSTLPGYKNMLEMMPGHANAGNFPKAQAIKDATMAYFILKYHTVGALSIHYNGSYHSDNNEGIGWYIQQQQPQLKRATISTVLQADLKKLLVENKGKADFIICIDEDMTTTY